jgi:hypothetical protein
VGQLDHMVRRQALQGLAHHGAGDAETLGQLLLAQARAGRQPVLDDGLVDALVDALGGRVGGAEDGEVTMARIVAKRTRPQPRWRRQSQTSPSVRPITAKEITVVTVPSA